MRESLRAKHVRLKVSAQSGLEVIVPQGFNRAEIPAILQRKQRWLEKATQRIQPQRQRLAQTPPGTLPDTIHLQAIAQMWQVEYQPAASSSITLTERPNRRLLVCGDLSCASRCYQVLQRWLMCKAQAYLAAWLQEMGQVHHLPFTKVSIRGQKTLWGSCSSRKTISLNYKLLFLPPAVVRYVLIHELCHTIELNHSARFWALVGDREPNYKNLDAELQEAWRYLPAWVEPFS